METTGLQWIRPNELKEQSANTRMDETKKMMEEERSKGNTQETQIGQTIADISTLRSALAEQKNTLANEVKARGAAVKEMEKSISIALSTVQRQTQRAAEELAEKEVEEANSAAEEELERLRMAMHEEMQQRIDTLRQPLVQMVDQIVGNELAIRRRRSHTEAEKRSSQQSCMRKCRCPASEAKAKRRRRARKQSDGSGTQQRRSLSTPSRWMHSHGG